MNNPKKMLVVLIVLALLSVFATATADEAEQGTGAEAYRTLQSGDKGEDVEQLKQRLIDLGYMTGKSAGYYGPSTQAAVEWFQQVVGLPVTGIADNKTQDALFTLTIVPC